MPFDDTQQGGGGGGGEPDDRTVAMMMLVADAFRRGMRPAHFGPGMHEMVSFNIQIEVHPSGKAFAINGGQMVRWEQIELDPDEDDIIG